MDPCETSEVKTRVFLKHQRSIKTTVVDLKHRDAALNIESFVLEGSSQNSVIVWSRFRLSKA
jgi:hypothetical protein